MMEQRILKSNNNYIELDNFLKIEKIKKLFLVCDEALKFLEIGEYFAKLEVRLGISVIYFNDFKPNPQYESVVKGVKSFKESECDMIMAIGGGSAIDVAKCIKLYANMDLAINYLEQKIIPNTIRFIAMPTTAGTGSEATRYAVIYYNGEKQSISDDSCIPKSVVMDASVLKTLPKYQKKATMLDALCHAIEAFWSVNSTEESISYSKQAIKLILDNKDAYLANDDTGNENMLKAANIAGKAINITQTTAGHAMCYKLTSMYGIAHGHAAALCVSVLWPYIIANIDKCVDLRGEKYLKNLFNELDELMTADDFLGFLEELELNLPVMHSEKDVELLKNSVNLVRLKNHPISLDEDIIEILYRKILK